MRNGSERETQSNARRTRPRSPLIGAEDSGGEGGHQVVGEAEQHDGAGEPGQHRRVQVVNQPEEEEQSR